MFNFAKNTYAQHRSFSSLSFAMDSDELGQLYLSDSYSGMESLNGIQDYQFFAPMRQLITIVDTESDLISSTSSDGFVQLGSTIRLSKTIKISKRDGLILDGNGFAIDGNKSVQCFWITESRVHLNELTITNCYSSYHGGGLLIEDSFLSLMRCIITGNIVKPKAKLDHDYYYYDFGDDAIFYSYRVYLWSGGGFFAENTTLLMHQSSVSNNYAVSAKLIDVCNSNNNRSIYPKTSRMPTYSGADAFVRYLKNSLET